jgi:hypothetical protein
MTNFKITGKEYKSTKGHYVKDSEHRTEDRLDRLESKLDKHIDLPMEKAHHSHQSQKDAPLPNMRKS